ncbi:MAG: hypothetical protein LUC33_01000, partial [Prevotellaceae bacterium]|nr:hypothetical protein [Prevotellaceae bacterium]
DLLKERQTPAPSTETEEEAAPEEEESRTTVSEPGSPSEENKDHFNPWASIPGSNDMRGVVRKCLIMTYRNDSTLWDAATSLTKWRLTEKQSLDLYYKHSDVFQDSRRVISDDRYMKLKSLFSAHRLIGPLTRVSLRAIYAFAIINEDAQKKSLLNFFSDFLGCGEGYSGTAAGKLLKRLVDVDTTLYKQGIYSTYLEAIRKY